MSKYSLQTECLENIEAYSDGYFDAELAVIESAVAIFDKAILMMEYVADGRMLPDCSMFMESTFFQEVNQGEQQTESDDNNQSGTNNNTPTEAERKQYNSENQFRQMNKKGDIEHIAISILLFIPRLLGFIVQCIVKLFKKIFNKDDEAKAAKADENTQKMTPEQIKEALKNITDGNDAGEDKSGEHVELSYAVSTFEDSVYSEAAVPLEQRLSELQKLGEKNWGSIVPDRKEWIWYDTSKVSPALKRFSEIISNIDTSSPEALSKFNKTEFEEAGVALIETLTTPVYHNAVHCIKNTSTVFQYMEELRNACDKKSQQLNSQINIWKSNNIQFSQQAVANIKDICKELKTGAKEVVGIVRALRDANLDFRKNIDAINNKASELGLDSGNQQNNQQPQEGGNPNGGQEQNNNPANAG